MSVVSENPIYQAVFTLVYTKKKVLENNLAKVAIQVNWPLA